MSDPATGKKTVGFGKWEHRLVYISYEVEVNATLLVSLLIHDLIGIYTTIPLLLFGLFYFCEDRSMGKEDAKFMAEILAIAIAAFIILLVIGAISRILSAPMMLIVLAALTLFFGNEYLAIKCSRQLSKGKEEE